MTTDINKLLERLRTYYGDDLACRMLLMDARHALEAMAGEVERLTSDVDALGDNLEKVVAERDRLKAAITTHVAGCVACGGSGVVFLCPERDDTAEAVREDCEECVGLRKALEEK